MKAITILGLLAVILIGFAAVILQFTRPELPTQRVLTDRNGKSHDVAIIGKEMGALVVQAKLTSSSYEIPIHSLELADRLYAHWLPQETPPQIRDLPVNRILTSTDGKTLEARVIGKTAKAVTVERLSDDSRFEIPLDRLSLADQRFLNRLRKIEAPEVPKLPPPDPGYIANRKAKIEELKERARLYEREIKSRTLSTNLHDKRKEDLIAVREEIRSLEVAIEAYQFNNKKTTEEDSKKK
jgi:hypothetical protein